MSQKKQKIIRLPEVIERVPLSKPSIYRLMATGDFPQSIRLGSRSVGWLESSIDKWIESRMNVAA